MNDETGDELDEAVAAFRDALEMRKVTEANRARVRALFEQAQAEDGDAFRALSLAEEKLQDAIKRMR